MNETINLVKDALENKSYELLVIIFFGLVLFRLEIIHTYVDARRKSRVTLLKECLDSSEKDSRLYIHYKESLESEYFRLSNKLRANSLERSLAFNVIDNSDNNVNMRHFSRADQFLSYSKSAGIKVKLTVFDRLWAWFSLFFACLLMAYALLLAASELTSESLNGNVILAIWLFCKSVLLMLGAVLVASLSWPYSAAKHIQKELDRKNGVVKVSFYLRIKNTVNHFANYIVSN